MCIENGERRPLWLKRQRRWDVLRMSHGGAVNSTPTLVLVNRQINNHSIVVARKRLRIAARLPERLRGRAALEGGGGGTGGDGGCTKILFK